MDIKNLVRDADKVRAACAVGNDGSVVALKPTRIMFPERFLEKQLASVGLRNYVVGIFAHIVEEKYYAVFLAAAMVEVKPSAIATVKVGEDSYLEMSFDPGDKVIVVQEAVQDKVLTYRIYDEMIGKGHMPWYLGYDDRVKLLFTANEMAGVDLLSNHAMLELNAAAISRDPNDISQYYRHVVKDYAMVDHGKSPTTIPLMSVSYGTTNAVSRLMGAYWEQGLNSELAHPSTEVQNIERLLRT